MNWFPILLFFALAALLLVCGLLIRFKKMYALIAGFNTMTEQEKAKIDKEKMGKTVAVLLYLLAALAAAAGVLFLLGRDTAGITAMLSFLPVTLFVVILTQKTIQPDAANWKKTSRSVNGLAIFFVLIVLLVVGMIYSNSRPNGFTVENSALVISGSYGETVPLSTVSEISVEKALPGGLQKTNGFDWESILKGHFRSDSGNVTLYVNTKAPVFLRIKAAGGSIYISTDSESATQSLYGQLKAALAGK